MTKPPDSVDIAVAGGGIAGMTAALAFAAKGRRVLVLERAPAIEDAGAGLQLSPNATRILARLGVLDALASVAVRPEAIMLRNAANLRTIARVPLGDEAADRWGTPYLVAHRADLQRALVRRVAEAPNILLSSGACTTDVVFDQEGATLLYERAGAKLRVACRLVVGADGVWSRLRACVRRDAASRFSGYVAWRTMLEGGALHDPAVFAADSVTAFLSPRFHLVAYPVRGGKAVNLVAVTKGRGLDPNWTGAADMTALMRAFTGAAPALRTMVEHALPWTAWPIHTVDAAPAWTRGGQLALLGDAAHAMTPFAAQGAAMAIEDTAVLAENVSRAANMTRALVSYEAARRPRVQRVAARGAFNRFVWHAAGPIALGRDMVLRLRPATHLMRDFDWLYGWDETADRAD